MTAALDMRTRTIAPGFWKNPELARCDAHARLMFAALWGLADRAGRLEDRPAKIRAEVFPFEPTIDADALLWQLHRESLALRYVALGHALIEIPGFMRYQRPYGHEPPSMWPGAHDDRSVLRVPQSENHLPIGDEVLRLSPVSCLLSPVYLPLAGEEQLPLENPRIFPPAESSVEQENRKPENQIRRVAASCPHELIRRLWHDMLPALPAPVEPWGATPARYLRARWRAQAEHEQWTSVGEGLAWFKALFGYVARSRFLCGRTGPRRAHETPFEITLEWLVKHEHWTKTLQGQYHDHAEGGLR